MVESLEEAAESVGKVDWDQFVATICESRERVIEEFCWWAEHCGEALAEAYALWEESCGRPPMTKNEKKQAWFNYVRERERDGQGVRDE